jgi:hypothetical protein
MVKLHFASKILASKMPAKSHFAVQFCPVKKSWYCVLLPNAGKTLLFLKNKLL